MNTEYHLAINGRDEGAITEDQIIDRIRNNTITGDMMLWQPGMAEWAFVRDMPQFSIHLNASQSPNPAKPLHLGHSVAGSSNQSSVNGAFTPQPGYGNNPVSPALAGRGIRLGAVFIDGAIVGVIMFLGIMLAVALAHAGGGSFQGKSIASSGTAVIVLVITIVCCFAIAIYQLWLLATKGQTIGKRICHIKVINIATNSAPGGKGVLLRQVIPGLMNSIPYIGWLIALVDILFIFREDRRCLHDLIAGTRVIEAGE